MKLCPDSLASQRCRRNAKHLYHIAIHTNHTLICINYTVISTNWTTICKNYKVISAPGAESRDLELLIRKMSGQKRKPEIQRCRCSPPTVVSHNATITPECTLAATGCKWQQIDCEKQKTNEKSGLPASRDVLCSSGHKNCGVLYLHIKKITSITLFL